MSSRTRIRQVNNEAPVAVNLPPPPPAVVHTIPSQNAGKDGSFKNFYHSSVKSFAAPQAGDFLKRAAEYIKRNEGVRNKLYKDSKGYWTIGIGHLVTPQEYELYKGKVLTEREILELFQKDMNKKLQLVKSYFGKAFDSYSEQLRIAILDGYFRGDLPGSPEARRLLKDGKFKQAAREYLNNKEYKAAVASGSGVASRMSKNAAIMAAER